MRQITVHFHNENGMWWAESPALPGFSSAADSLEELRRLTRDGVDFALNGIPHLILEISEFPDQTEQSFATSGDVFNHRVDEAVAPKMMKREPTRSVQTTNPRAAFT